MTHTPSLKDESCIFSAGKRKTPTNIHRFQLQMNTVVEKNLSMQNWVTFNNKVIFLEAVFVNTFLFRDAVVTVSKNDCFPLYLVKGV